MSRRACSFCRVSGHNISVCNDPTALELINSAEFKCRVALQYVGSDAEQNMFISLLSWFRRLTVKELRLLIWAKNYGPIGHKDRLIATAILGYYLWQPVPNGRSSNWFEQVQQSYQRILLGSNTESTRGIYNGQQIPRVAFVEELEEPRKILIIDGELSEESIECPICFETTETDMAQTNCGHMFCRPCITTHTKGNITACPCCRTGIDLLVVN